MFNKLRIFEYLFVTNILLMAIDKFVVDDFVDSLWLCKLLNRQLFVDNKVRCVYIAHCWMHPHWFDLPSKTISVFARGAYLELVDTPVEFW